MPGVSLAELERRVNALTQEVDELRELVDGQESWSHRKRLHKVEDTLAGEKLLAAALKELRSVRNTKVRDRVTWALACTAIVVSLLHPHFL